MRKSASLSESTSVTPGLGHRHREGQNQGQSHDSRVEVGIFDLDNHSYSPTGAISYARRQSRNSTHLMPDRNAPRHLQGAPRSRRQRRHSRPQIRCVRSLHHHCDPGFTHADGVAIRKRGKVSAHTAAALVRARARLRSKNKPKRFLGTRRDANPGQIPHILLRANAQRGTRAHCGCQTVIRKTT